MYILFSYWDGNNLYLLAGYEGNRKFIDPDIPTIARCEAEGNSWYQGVNKLTIPEYLVNKCFIIPKETSDAK
jgi:hypothetical protein